MVTFLTLLLGLVVGERQIELAADDRVASIEVWLDRTLVGTLRGPPWKITCDFGDRLAPHLLEAVGRDHEGRELDRAVQRINLPRQHAEVSLALHGGEQGYRAVEIAWSSPGGAAPEEIHLHFDGEPIDVSGPLVALPPHDLSITHVIAAEVVFSTQLRATGGLAFGGEFGEDISSELTAVQLDPGRTGARRLPSPETVETWLRVSGGVPRVVAVEDGPFELIVVRDESSLEPLRGMGSNVRAGSSGADQGALYFVNSRPSLVRGADGSWSALFPISHDASADGLRWSMTHLFFPSDQAETAEELTAAVAVAGLRAAGSSHPRGVLLVRGASPVGEAAPGFDPLSIRRYLAALRVPLFYWRIDQSGGATPDGWGTPTPIRDARDLRRAESELASALRPHFLAWLDGAFIPDQVTMTSAGSTVMRLAGAGVE